MVDNAYQTLREAGAVIEEPLDSDDGDDENHELLDEKASLLNLSLNASRPEPIPNTNANGADDVAEIRVQSHDSRDTTSTSRSNSVLR